MVPVHHRNGPRNWQMGHQLHEEESHTVRGSSWGGGGGGAGRSWQGSGAPAPGRRDCPGSKQRRGIEDSLGGSFRDPHFHLVAVHDMTLRDKTTQPVTLSCQKYSPAPPVLHQNGLLRRGREISEGRCSQAEEPAGIKDREQLLLEMAHAEPRQQLLVTETQPSDVLSSHAWALTFMPLEGHRIFHRV